MEILIYIRIDHFSIKLTHIHDRLNNLIVVTDISIKNKCIL